MRLLWLADVLRAAGLTVHEYPGWQTRGYESFGPLRGVACHATAGSRTSTDAGETRTLWVTGSTSAPAPIAQCYLSRSGAWTVGASGRCNHVLIGDRGPHEGYGNYHLIGVEAQNDNRGEPWSPAMLDSYQRGVAAICRRMGWGAGVVVAHREHQSGKSDPFGVDMTAFRQRVADLLAGGDDDMTPEQDRRQYNDDRINSAILAGQTTVTKVLMANGTYRDFPLPLAQQAADAATNSAAALAAVRELTARPPVQSAPVDPAVVQSAVHDALSDPQVLAAIAKSVADENARRQQA